MNWKNPLTLSLSFLGKVLEKLREFMGLNLYVKQYTNAFEVHYSTGFLRYLNVNEINNKKTSPYV